MNRDVCIDVIKWKCLKLLVVVLVGIIVIFKNMKSFYFCFFLVFVKKIKLV